MQVRKVVGFVAGTPVHTPNGLVRIEQINVGDLVLSKPEDGGELVFKPVTQTFVHHEQRVVAVSLMIDRTFKAMRSAEDDQRASRMLVMTAEHPVRTLMDGWLAAEKLGRGKCVVLSNGAYARVTASAAPVLMTKNPQHGLHSPDESLDCGWGQLIDFSRYPMVDFSQFDVEFDAFEDGYVPPEMLRTVYSFEVADCHTYFVGELYDYDEAGQAIGEPLGVWVGGDI